MTLVEAMIAMVVIAVALLALVTLVTSAGAVQDDSRERTLAYNAARRIIEDMRSFTQTTQIYDKYKSGGTTGNEFIVDDLPAGTGTLTSTTVTTGNGTSATIQKAAQGMIYFPEEKPGAGVFTETLDTDALLKKDFEFPKDLNRDGDNTDEDLKIDQISILPVKVKIEWQTKGGKTSKVEIVSYIVVER